MREINQISSAQLLGQCEEHLVVIDKGIAIHQHMVKGFTLMQNAATDAGISLKIASGFRSFERQLMIWNNKFSGKTPIKTSSGDIISPTALNDIELIHSILLFSALPGGSRHHWGCDIDVYAANLLPDNYQLQLEPWEYGEQGPLAKLSYWLKKNAHLFGFYFPYASFKGGVAQEPWHLSYAPIARQYQQAFDIDLLAKELLNSNILGKAPIIEHLPSIAERYIKNTCKIPENVNLSTR